MNVSKQLKARVLLVCGAIMSAALALAFTTNPETQNKAQAVDVLGIGSAQSKLYPVSMSVETQADEQIAALVQPVIRQDAQTLIQAQTNFDQAKKDEQARKQKELIKKQLEEQARKQKLLKLKEQQRSQEKEQQAQESIKTSVETGFKTVVASVYNQVGRPTATGRLLTSDALIIAHKTLPLGTRVELKYGDATVRCVIGDRGPYVKGRDIDLAPAVQRALGIYDGVVKVSMRILN